MRRRSSAAFACMRAGISSENSSSRRSGICSTPLPPLAAVSVASTPPPPPPPPRPLPAIRLRQEASADGGRGAGQQNFFLKTVPGEGRAFVLLPSPRLRRGGGGGGGADGLR